MYLPMPSHASSCHWTTPQYSIAVLLIWLWPHDEFKLQVFRSKCFAWIEVSVCYCSWVILLLVPRTVDNHLQPNGAHHG